MKRLIAGLTSAVLMILSATPMAANAADLFGDVNLDGTVNAIDASKIMYMYYQRGMGITTDNYDRVAPLSDMDGDGVVGSLDAIYLCEAICTDAVTDGESHGLKAHFDVPNTSFGCISKPKYAAVNDSAISILCPQFTHDDLVAWDYEVPIVVTIAPSSGMSFCEFGIESELPIKCGYDLSEDDEMYRRAYANLKETAWRSMLWLNYAQDENFAWFSIATYKVIRSGRCALMSVKVPKYYDGGETFNIRIVSETKTRRAFAGQITDKGEITSCFLLKGGNIGNVDLIMPAEGAHPFYGDVDGDGVLTVIDAMMLQKYLLGLPDMPIDPELSDICTDGCIDVYDLAMLKRKLIEMK